MVIISGGLTAVIYTDVLQCTIMLIGAIVLAIMSKYYYTKLIDMVLQLPITGHDKPRVLKI